MEPFAWSHFLTNTQHSDVDQMASRVYASKDLSLLSVYLQLHIALFSKLLAFLFKLPLVKNGFAINDEVRD